MLMCDTNINESHCLLGHMGKSAPSSHSLNSVIIQNAWGIRKQLCSKMMSGDRSWLQLHVDPVPLQTKLVQPLRWYSSCAGTSLVLVQLSCWYSLYACLCGVQVIKGWYAALPGEMEQIRKDLADTPYTIDRNALPQDSRAPSEAALRKSKVEAHALRPTCRRAIRRNRRSAFLGQPSRMLGRIAPQVVRVHALQLAL